MAWTISTYAGTRATGSPSNYRTAMFELCRAVQERSAAISGTGASSVTFLKADGTTTTSPSMADLNLMRCSGAGNYAKTNLTTIRNFITVTLAAGRWMTTSGGTTPYSVASMETAIGAALDVPTKINEARAWQAYQDALDLMLYAYTPLTTPSTGTFTGYNSNVYTTAALAWAGRTDNAGTGGSTPVGLLNNPCVYWYDQGSGTTYTSSVRHTITALKFRQGISATASTLLGVLTSADYIYYSTFTNTTLGSIAFDMDGDTITISSTGSGTATATPTMGAAIQGDLTITTSEPGTMPFSFSSGSAGAVGIQITGMDVYHNLTTILTDQA